MIRNLNQMNFHEYGTILTERPLGEKGMISEDNSVVLDVMEREADIYLLESDTWISRNRGKVVISVSLDGKRFRHFVLDRPVCVRAGVFVSLNSIFTDGAISYSTRKPVEPIGKRPIGDFSIPAQLQIDNMYTFFYEEREKGFVFSGESHPALELLYVDQGSLHVVIDGKEHCLQQGEMIIVGENQWHTLFSNIDVAPRFISLMFGLTLGDVRPLLNRKLAAPQSIVTMLQRMNQEQKTMDPFSNDIIIAHLHMLLLLLLREQAAPTTRKLQTSNSIHSENEIIRQAQQYVSAHIREKLSVPLVAKHVDVSPSYLTALFHKNLQISPGEYIRRTKLQESKQMIREKNLNFTEIAAELQYSTVHHFSRQFKEKFGITPTEYAKSVR